MQIYVLSLVYLPNLVIGNTVFRIKIGDEKKSCFEITNIRALDIVMIYSNPK